MSSAVPPWFGQQRGSGFAPIDIEFEGEVAADAGEPRDDVAPGVLGVLAPLVVFFAAVTLSGLPLVAVIPLSLAGMAWLTLGAASLAWVAISAEFPAWAGLITFFLALIGRVIKWTFIIVTIAFAVAMVFGAIDGMISGRR